MRTEREITKRINYINSFDSNNHNISTINALKWTLESSEEKTKIERLEAKIKELETDIELANMTIN